MGWGISSAVRFEHGAKPGAKALAQMLDVAAKHGQNGIAAELRAYLSEDLRHPFFLEAARKHELRPPRNEFVEDKKRWTEIMAIAADIGVAAMKLGGAEGVRISEQAGRLSGLVIQARWSALGGGKYK
jgi:hypothetical protein